MKLHEIILKAQKQGYKVVRVNAKGVHTLRKQ